MTLDILHRARAFMAPLTALFDAARTLPAVPPAAASLLTMRLDALDAARKLTNKKD